MKRFLISIAITSFTTLSLTACQTPSGSNPTSSSSPTPSPTTTASPASGTSGSITTKAQAIAYLNCLKTKNPGTATALDVHIGLLNNKTDAQFAIDGGAQTYLTITQGYDRTGCI